MAGLFVLANIVTSVSGLSIANYEFLLFALIGFFLGTVLFVFGSKNANGGVIVVIAFFISINYFIDYQPVPFSTALALLFLLFMLDSRPSGIAVKVTMLVLYTGLLFTHLFVPLFFVLYLLLRIIIKKIVKIGYSIVTFF